MKRLAGLAAIVIFAAAACSPSSTPTATTVPDTPPAPTIPTQPIPTDVAEPDAPTATPALPTREQIVQVQPDDWARGPETAAVTFIEWSDFECPFCAELAPLLKRLEDAYPDDIRVAYRHFPLTEIHDKAQIAAEASEAAGAQGKFWEMHDLLFEAHTAWKDLSVDEFRVELSEYAASIELDVEQFDADLDSGKFTAKVTAARDLALTLGLGGTPFLLINESPWPESLSFLSYTNLEGVVKFYTQLPDRQYDGYPPTTIDSTKTYVATIATDQGDIVIELYPDEAPLAVNSFVFLARDGWYDNLVFHRVVDNFVAQAGDLTGLGIGGVGYVYETESSPDLQYDGPGWVGVARTAELDTNGGQFFITRSGIGQEQLDALNGGPYTIFGRVIEGQDVVDSLTVYDTQSGPEVAPSVIMSVTVEEK